jgi:Bacterial dnaA protein helix-turn-helix
MRTSEHRTRLWRLSLEQIEATVSDHLGNGRVPGNQSAACLSRQVSMYLAKNVGGWSTTRIGRFYNGRHHTTVLHAIEKIERLRQTDESLDALIEVIIAELSPGTEGRFTERFEPGWTAALIEAIADRVLDKIRRPQTVPDRKLTRCGTIDTHPRPAELL